MKVLIVAATQFEIEPFITAHTNTKILITGMGIAATTYHLTKAFCTGEYDLVINAGVAGSFKDSLIAADVVLVSQDTFGDIGISEKEDFKTLFEKGFMSPNEFPFKNGWLKNENDFMEKYPLPKVNAITINKITDSPLHAQQLQQKFSADIETMEGAAFHYVCLQQKINFLQLRSVSNKVGERDKTKWKLKQAIDNLNKELLKLIENY